ncbi:YtxH domain-containing protein [bacterium]|nr:YtxH domain-containing protein [bacterium]
MDIITLKKFIPIVVGGIIGFAYYKFIGCSSGACPITASPYGSVIYGMIIGAFFIK